MEYKVESDFVKTDVKHIHFHSTLIYTRSSILPYTILKRITVFPELLFVKSKKRVRKKFLTTKHNFQNYTYKVFIIMSTFTQV